MAVVRGIVPFSIGCDNGGSYALERFDLATVVVKTSRLVRVGLKAQHMTVVEAADCVVIESTPTAFVTSMRIHNPPHVVFIRVGDRGEQENESVHD